MIFSIIIIIAVIATSFYVIQYFTKLSKCSTIGLFYEDIQSEVNEAWQGTTSRTLFTGTVPGAVDYVCFGNMTRSPGSADTQKHTELMRLYRVSQSNVFMYPSQKSCPGIGDYKIDHANMQSFFCMRANDGKITVALEKGAFDSSVTVKAQ